MDKNKLAEEYAAWHVVSTEIENRVVSHYLAGFDAAESIANAKIKELEERNSELEDHTMPLESYQELQTKITELDQQFKKADYIIQRFITKSNGLSFYCREPSVQTELFLKYPTLIEKLQGLYDFQCDVESEYLKSKGAECE